MHELANRNDFGKKFHTSGRIPQLNPDNSNSDNSKSPLIRSKVYSLWFCPTLSSHFTSDNSNSSNSKSPLIRSNLCSLELDFTPIFRSLIAKLNEKQ